MILEDPSLRSLPWRACANQTDQTVCKNVSPDWRHTNVKRDLRDVNLVMNPKDTALKSVEMLYSCPSQVLVVRLVLNFVNSPDIFFFFFWFCKPESIAVAYNQRTLIHSM